MTYTATTFSTAEAFLQRTRPFLEARESLNSLILGISIRLVEHPEWEDFPFSLTTIEDLDGTIAVTALMTPPRQITLAGIDPPPLQAVETLVASLIASEFLFRSHWRPPGVIGPQALAEMFTRVWSEANGLVYHKAMSQRMYELRKVSAFPDCPGRLCPASESDLETVAAWHNAFLAEAMEPDTLESSRKIAARCIAAGDVFLWQPEFLFRNSGPVSMAVRSRPTLHGASIGGVYTPTHQRRKGYASATVAALSQLILDSGKQFCTLFTDLSNPTSNHIYMKIGYVPVGDFALYHFESPDPTGV